jgi:hypothetical protein
MRADAAAAGHRASTTVIDAVRVQVPPCVRPIGHVLPECRPGWRLSTVSVIDEHERHGWERLVRRGDRCSGQTAP